MNRRTYLAALATTTLSGCIDRYEVVGWSRSATPSARTPDGVQRRVSLAGVADAGGEYGVHIDAEVVEPTVTAEHPARVRVSTTNDGPKRDVSVASGGCCLFNRSGGVSDPSGLWLHRGGSSEHVERDGDRWTRDAPADERRAYAAYGCLSKTYAAGESLSNEYHVWDDYRGAGYYPPGTYRFAELVTVSEPGSDMDDEDAVVAAFTWGFSVRVSQG